MLHKRQTPARLAAVALASFLAGCSFSGEKPTAVTNAQPSSTSVAFMATPSLRDAAGETIPVAYQVPVESAASSPVQRQLADSFVQQRELSLDELVSAVEARNPSLQAVTAAWRAAADRYPQQVSLDDPMFQFMMAPGGMGKDDSGGWAVQASQKLPWPGKRELRGVEASADAEAMHGDVGDQRLRLDESARLAFYDYYLAQRLMEVNASTRKLLAEFRDIALHKYQVTQATEQDVLQTDVELANQKTRYFEFQRDEKVARARINTLLHQPPNSPLPPPPSHLTLPDTLPAVESLQVMAVQARPDLYAQLSRVRSAQANLELANKEYYPDVELMARYDAFWQPDLRPEVGMNLNVPIRYSRRSAAVDEACERLQQQRWEYQSLLDQVRFEVQSGWDRATQSRDIVRLYQDQAIPASERNVESARANYTSGKLDFLRLIDAERLLNSQREMYHQAVVEYNRRRTELERAVGERIGTSE
jgi:outer membrane protein TolC